MPPWSPVAGPGGGGPPGGGAAPPTPTAISKLTTKVIPIALRIFFTVPYLLVKNLLKLYIKILKSQCPRNSMDRMEASGASNVGSIPTGGTLWMHYS